jgi:hypothetical protein
VKVFYTWFSLNLVASRIVARYGSYKPVIPNLGYAYPPGYELGHLGIRDTNLKMAGKVIIGPFTFSYNI